MARPWLLTRPQLVTDSDVGNVGTIDFINGSIGSYPNYFFDVEGKDVPDLFDLLENYDGSPEYVAKANKYGVSRADDDFWETYDWFQHWFDEDDPLRAGRYDLNRYYAETADRNN